MEMLTGVIIGIVSVSVYIGHFEVSALASKNLPAPENRGLFRQMFGEAAELPISVVLS